METLFKKSPLSAVFENFKPKVAQMEGWEIVQNLGNEVEEKAHLKKGSLLVDWSHVEKISIRGKTASQEAGKIIEKSAGLKPLQACWTEEIAVAKLTEDEYLILCRTGLGQAILNKLDHKENSILDQTGALGCLVLAGGGRDRVMMRSSAMNMEREIIKSGSVVQTTIHFVHCTLIRTDNLEIFIHTRDYSESLFDALMDIGRNVGLRPSGVTVVPVSFKGDC